MTPSWSSGVPFYPPSTKYWRIGGKWYDFARFLDLHPGGKRILTLCRDRFEDCTFVFESHHPNYKRARAVIRKYEVSGDEATKADQVARRCRPPRKSGSTAHHDAALDALRSPELLDDSSFYSELRRKVALYLKRKGHPSGGPTFECKALFWTCFVLWASLWIALYRTGYLSVAVAVGVVSSWLGAFGHNWIHQPKYKLWAYLSLDTIGFSSDGWFREHILQHHMYTNTPWDNHFKGTDPFLITDPTVERSWFQSRIAPFLNPIVLTFGLHGNYAFWASECAAGRERFTLWRLCLPLQIALMVQGWGFARGMLLCYIAHGVIGIYYFTMALMNHNAAHTMDVSARNNAADWGQAQLQSSADWGVQMPFLSAGIYLWLNYHTVHHLFPRVDMSHHPHIQQILMDTCKKFGVQYVAGDVSKLYLEMVESFRTPRSLMQEIIVYSGGL